MLTCILYFQAALLVMVSGLIFLLASAAARALPAQAAPGTAQKEALRRSLATSLCATS